MGSWRRAHGCLALLVAVGFGWSSAASAQDTGPLFEDVTATNIPTLDGASMDAAMVDVDGDGDLDIVVAVEYGLNRLLINNGNGVFSDRTNEQMPAVVHDSEDVGVADFDGDGDLDLAFVSEEDANNELFLNDGNGYFTNASERLGGGWGGVSNALHVADVDLDGSPDLVIGNAGQNEILLNDGRGWFESAPDRLPMRGGTTQDIELADVDGDGDLDILEGKENSNPVLLNDGSGYFAYADGRIELRDAAEETREADLGDVDCDGDLDIYFANVHHVVPNSDPADRLLINDGDGVFSDQTAERLPGDALDTWEVDFLDIDCDGDLDIITGNGELMYRPETGWRAVHESPFLVFLNNGHGYFSDGTERVFGTLIESYGWDVAAGDVNGDGSVDLYLAGRYSRDRLLLSTAGEACQRRPCSLPRPHRVRRLASPSRR
jgi:hypothetical protein